MGSLGTERGRLEMEGKKARELLRDIIVSNDDLFNGQNYVNWKTIDEEVCLDGFFTSEDLEAIAWWMKNKGKKGEDW